MIGLAPYSFHYDLSKTLIYRYVILQYFITFGDLHNFNVPAEVYEKFFRKNYLETKISLESFDVKNHYYAGNNHVRYIGSQERLEAREVIDGWSEKNYPETRTENIKILDEYLTLCEENNIRPIMFLLPMTEGYRKHFKRQRIDEFYYLVRQACRKHPSAIFIDGWKLHGVTDADFYDCAHLNIEGAAKFSTFLNNFIEQLERR